MKKLVTLLLTAALAITAATTAFADDAPTTATIGPDTNGNPTPASGNMNVTYTVAPSYTVTIPELVTLNTDAPSTATVTAENVTIPCNQKLKVTLNSNNNFYVITNEGARDTYKVTIGTSTTPISNGATVLETMYGTKSTVLTFELDKRKVTYSGEYKDTVTFTVGLVTTNP
ncbi:hypothetical protein [uncultured Gemmiger sp.]|uniref:hypothetical protein n=1 Tax=uncultured Gemmiger sp. TaxID=1623490 RepID=UPI0025FA6BA2|nr:hypothetical protein [uncultured Gemmiger sp.]